MRYNILFVLILILLSILINYKNFSSAIAIQRLREVPFHGSQLDCCDCYTFTPDRIQYVDNLWVNCENGLRLYTRIDRYPHVSVLRQRSRARHS